MSFAGPEDSLWVPPPVHVLPSFVPPSPPPTLFSPAEVPSREQLYIWEYQFHFVTSSLHSFSFCVPRIRKESLHIFMQDFYIYFIIILKFSIYEHIQQYM